MFDHFYYQINKKGKKNEIVPVDKDRRAISITLSFLALIGLQVLSSLNIIVTL